MQAEKIGSAYALARFIVGGNKQRRLPTLEGGWSQPSTDTWALLCTPHPGPHRLKSEVPSTEVQDSRLLTDSCTFVDKSDVPSTKVQDSRLLPDSCTFVEDICCKIKNRPGSSWGVSKQRRLPTLEGGSNYAGCRHLRKLLILVNSLLSLLLLLELQRLQRTQHQQERWHQSLGHCRLQASKSWSLSTAMFTSDKSCPISSASISTPTARFTSTGGRRSWMSSTAMSTSTSAFAAVSVNS